ncbi:MAG: hypothetical protein CXT78_03140 [Thaumarchaeota archaeon]|nr:MAG: hypothetical protein CXT78_03140 [Nitrososphaerota archaeon]
MIKIGLMVDSDEIPLWINLMIEEIIKLNFVKISVILKDTSKKNIKNKLNHKIKEKILYNWYLSYEKKRFRPSKNLNINQKFKKLENINQMEVFPILKNSTYYLSDEEIEKIEKYDLDLIIRLGSNKISGKILSITKFGVWSYYSKNNNFNKIKFGSFWEILKNESITKINLYLDNDSNNQVISKSVTSIDPLYITRNEINKNWKNIELILNELHKIHELDKIGIIENEKEEITIIPNNFQIIQFMINHWKKYFQIRRKFRNKIEQWGILFDFDQKAFDSIEKSNKIYAPKDRYYADPFIIKKNEDYFVFIEEVIYQQQKGHISYFKIDKNGNYNLPEKILENKYHMSYPFVFEFEDNYYMIPETSENKSIDLYKCKKFPDQWEFEKTIIKNINAVDSTLLRKNNKWWLFTSIQFMESSPNDSLSIFYSDDLFSDKWTPLPKNPVVSDVRKSRSAGKIFELNGEHYRPAQDCAGGYGKGIIFNKIITLNESEYYEEEVKSIYSEFDNTIEGIHTFAQCEKLRIFDFKKLKNNY